MLTRDNFYAHIFPSLKELATLCITSKGMPYPTLPEDCISYIGHLKKYSVILFVTKLGSLTLPQPVPIAELLGYKEIAYRVFQQGTNVVLRRQE